MVQPAPTWSGRLAQLAQLASAGIPIAQAAGLASGAPDQIGRAVAARIRYAQEDQEQFSSVGETLAAGAEDCDGIAVVTAAALAGAGHPVALQLFADRPGAQHPSHVAAVVPPCCDAPGLVVDPTPQPGHPWYPWGQPLPIADCACGSQLAGPDAEDLRDYAATGAAVVAAVQVAGGVGAALAAAAPAAVAAGVAYWAAMVTQHALPALRRAFGQSNSEGPRNQNWRIAEAELWQRSLPHALWAADGYPGAGQGRDPMTYPAAWPPFADWPMSGIASMNHSVAVRRGGINQAAAQDVVRRIFRTIATTGDRQTLIRIASRPWSGGAAAEPPTTRLAREALALPAQPRPMERRIVEYRPGRFCAVPEPLKLHFGRGIAADGWCAAPGREQAAKALEAGIYLQQSGLGYMTPIPAEVIAGEALEGRPIEMDGWGQMWGWQRADLAARHGVRLDRYTGYPIDASGRATGYGRVGHSPDIRTREGLQAAIAAEEARAGQIMAAGVPPDLGRIGQPPARREGQGSASPVVLIGAGVAALAVAAFALSRRKKTKRSRRR